VIEAVARIGKYVQTNNKEDRLKGFIEDPFANGKYNRVLVVVLKEEMGEYSFGQVDLQGQKEYQKYLYKGNKGNVSDATPTCKITKIERTFNKKFLRWFDKYEEYPISQDEKQSLEKMRLAIRDEKDRILMDLQKEYSNINPGENAIITLGIEQDDELKYLNDCQTFRNILLNNNCEKFVRRYGVESLGKNAMCSICKKVKEKVYGFGIPWKFHTFDKPGFIAGGFNATDSWKNTPICCECASNLELGKKHIEERLNFDFYGFRYLLVPKLAFTSDFSEIMNILSGKDQKKKLRINRETKNITSDEDEIFEIVKEKEDYISNSLIFYREEGSSSSFRILLLIDGVLPSRFKKLFNEKDKVDERFKSYYDLLLSDPQKEKIHFEFNFGVLRRFFPQESKNRTFDKIFLELVNKTFVGDKIDYYLLIDFIMRKVRTAFIRDRPTNIDMLNGFLLLHYFKELNLFRTSKEGMKEMDEDENGLKPIGDLNGLQLEQKVEQFFDANKSFFTSDAKKATFLEGVLTQNLLNIQWNDKKATPFRTKLHGLKLNEAIIKRLLPDIQNKLEEYGKNYYRDLESIIAHHFVSAGVKWKETDDELSFYFVLGMDMHKLFKNEKEEEEGTGQEA
jgi:CRISPR-associated protein Csh1